MRVAGIDCGTHAVKVVLLRAGLTRTAVLDTVEVPRRGGALPEALHEALGRLSEQPGLVCVGLDRSSTLFRTVQLPFADRAKVAKAAPFAAEEVLPVKLDRLRVMPLPARLRPDRRYDVPLLAAPVQELEARRAAVPEGLPAVLQLDSLGSVEALYGTGAGPERGKAVVLVDLGESKTCIEVLDGEGLVTSRSLRIGCARLAAAAAPSLGAPEGDAGRAFREAFAEAKRTPPEEATRAVLEVLGALADEIRRTLLSLPADMEPQRLLLTGGGARVRLLTSFLAEKLDLRVEVMGVPAVAARGVPAPERFSAAYGLALVAAERGRFALGFEDEPVRASWADPVVAGILAGSLLMGGLVHGALLRLEAYRLESEAAGLRAQAAELMESLGRRPGTPVQPALERTRALLETFRSVGRSPQAVLDALAESVPVGARLRFRAVTLDGESVRVEGEVGTFVLAEDFEEAVREHEGFEDVKLTQQARPRTRAGQVTNSFVLEATLREEAFR